jgi:hypothetical protein
MKTGARITGTRGRTVLRCLLNLYVFNKELARNEVFVDLRNGEAHCVFTVYKSTEHIPEMPEDMVQTFLMKILPVQELTSLRQQCKFTNREPEYVIVPNLLAEC